MVTKDVVDRLKAAEALNRAAEAHVDAIGDRLTDMLQPFARRGDPIPDLGVAMALLGRRLRSLGEAMRNADRDVQAVDGGAAHEMESARSRRDAAIAAYDAAFDDTTKLVMTLLHVAGVEQKGEARVS